MVSAKRNINAVLAALEQRMAVLEEVQENNRVVSREMSDEDVLELLLVYAEIGHANQMSFSEALARLLGLDPDKAETIAGQLGPLAEERMEQRIQLHHGSL
jgi:hypothetical protein